MDATYVGGKPRQGKQYDNPQRGRGAKQAPRVGAVERMGNVTLV